MKEINCIHRYSFNHQARVLATWLKVKNHHLGNCIFIVRLDHTFQIIFFFLLLKLESDETWKLRAVYLLRIEYFPPQLNKQTRTWEENPK